LILSCIFGYDKLTLYNTCGLILSMIGALWLSKILGKNSN